MTDIQKRKALLILGLCVMLIALIAMSISQIHLEPGLPSPLLVGSHIVISEMAQSQLIDLPILTFILRLAGIVFALYLLMALYTGILGISWKKLLKMLKEFSLILAMLIILLLVLSLFRSVAGQPNKLVSPPAEINPPAFTAVDSPPALLIWITGIFLALIAAILLANWIRFKRITRRNELLAVEVEKARQNILAGSKLDEVILRCYQEMGSIIRQEGGLERQAFTTPTEFVAELCSAGLPQAPVLTLTGLFENVRYGHITPSNADEQEALSNLQKLTNYLRDKKSTQKNDSE